MPISSISERRTLRRAIRLDCQVIDEEAFSLAGRRALDLSPQGMLVESQRDVSVGDAMLVSFRMPGTRLFFDLNARVARLVYGRRPLDHGACFGLAFENVDPTTRATLSSLLRGLPPPIPARGVRRDYARMISDIARAA